MQARVRAPKLKDAHWVQGDPFEIQGERPYFILLDFWTFGCINCLNVLADLKRLEAEFGSSLEVVSIHTPKFSRESDDETLKTALRSLQIRHRVIQDRDRRLWDAFAVKAWPTWILIDPKGYILLHRSGEKQYGLFRRALLDLAEPAGRGENLDADNSLVAVDSSGEYLATATAGSLKVFKKEKLLCEREGFRRITALKIAGGRVYIADREAEQLSMLDLTNLSVEPIAKALRSPWGIECLGDKLYVALAGSHQLLRIDLASRERRVVAGNRYEGLRDGCGENAMLAQPSSLLWDYDRLWFVDAESSSLRYWKEGCVTTVIGEGLFGYGDDNEKKLLQHPQSIAVGRVEDGCGAGRIFIADTYNDKIKLFDPMEQSIMTLIEKVSMPISIAKNGCRLYIVSLGARDLKVFDIKTMQFETLELR